MESGWLIAPHTTSTFSRLNEVIRTQCGERHFHKREHPAQLRGAINHPLSTIHYISSQRSRAAKARPPAASSSVVCTASTNCWAVGEYGKVGNAGILPGLNQALRWNGRSWSKVSTPNPSGTASNDRNYLNGVTCIAATNCWAVGSHGTGPPNGKVVNEALHWHASAWVNS